MVDESSEIVTGVPGTQDVAAVETAGAVETNLDEGFSRANIYRNMALIVTVSACMMAVQQAGFNYPLLPLITRYYHATNWQIGLIQGASWTALFSFFFAPYISRRFRIKKWLFLGMTLPNYTPCMILGLAVMYPVMFHQTPQSLLNFVIIVSLFNWLTTGLFALPFQESLIGSIPRSHAGRTNGLSNSVGVGLSIATMAAATWLTKTRPGEHSLGLLLFLSAALGFVYCAPFAFLKEKPARVEESPIPWSRDMIRALWENRPFIRLLGVSALSTIAASSIGGFIVNGGIGGFVSVYGMKELGATDANIGFLGLMGQIVALVSAAPVGYIFDRFGAKKLLPLSMLGAVIVFLGLIFFRNLWGFYAAGIFGVFVGIIAGTASLSLFYILPKDEHRTGLFTIQLMWQCLIMAVGFILSGWILDHHVPFQTLFIIAAALSLAAYPLYIWAVAPIPDPKESQVGHS